MMNGTPGANDRGPVLAWKSCSSRFQRRRALAGGKFVPRESFCTGAGEVTNFCRTYTKVPYRNLCEIPRVDSAQKQAMFGDVAVPALPRDRMQKEAEANGHPVFWAEWKPIALHASFFRDWNVNEVVDLTPGSGAAAVGALYSTDVKYLGGCMERSTSEVVAEDPPNHVRGPPPHEGNQED